MILAKQLKIHRKKSGLSQSEVAEQLNISRQSISKWENGRGYPDIDNLVLLSQVYEVTIDDLLKENEKLKKKILVNKEEINLRKRTLKFIKGSIEVNESDEGLTLLIIGAISALLFPLGIIIIPFILLRNKKTNTLYKLIYIICICSLVINLFSFADVITDYFDVPWGKTTIEKID